MNRSARLRRLQLASLVLAASGLAGTAVWLGACGGGGSDRPPPTSSGDPEARPLPDPRIPAGGTSFAPSHARVAEGQPLDMAILADVDTCETCHADVVAQWRSSAHAHSSFDNPWYRAGVEEVRREVGLTESRFCAGCHDPLLLFGGRMDEPEIAADDPLAHGGITCMVCHGVQSVRPDGNASYTLATREIPVPRQGDAESLMAHRERMMPDPVRSGTLCGSCHRGFLGPEMGNVRFLPGMDDAGPWRASAYAGSHAALLDEPVEERDCRGCHMADEAASSDVVARGTGKVRSHRFAGAHTPLAALQGDAAQLEAVRSLLRQAATLDVAAIVGDDGRRWLPADGAAVGPGDAFTVDVVVRNTGTGHAFPGGARDTQDTWIELRILDAAGGVVAEAGTQHEHRDDPTAHRLITLLLDEAGQPDLRHLVHRFRAVAYDHTVPARDARVTRYGVELPEALGPDAFPLRVEARLVHRRHVREMHDFACEATRSARGREILAAAPGVGRVPLDGCVPQPVTEIGRAAVTVGAGSEDPQAQGAAARAEWRRLYDHALGLLHDVQERLDDARPSIEGALAALADDPEAGSHERAMILALRAKLEARQGRLDEALEWADRAEELAGPHPAIDRIRGHAHAQVWRWDDAADAFGRMSERTPGFTVGWRELARARGSAGDDRGALEAAVAGLALQPRDEGLLRSQALALEHLGVAPSAPARDAFLTHRVPDDAQQLRFTCDRTVPYCERDRQPVPRIDMRLRR